MAYVGTGAASAWVNFDGTGTPSIRDDHNCSSIGAVSYTHLTLPTNREV